MDNAELLVVHRQADPQAVELLAGLGDTEETWENTHKVSDHHAGLFGLDEPGERARRLTAHYKAHPDAIKQLRTGQAFVIETRPAHRVHKVQVQALH